MLVQQGQIWDLMLSGHQSSFLQNIQDTSVAHTASHSVDVGAPCQQQCPGQEANDSLPPSAEVKKDCSHTSILPVCLESM
jgi:hypothetical protein